MSTWIGAIIIVFSLLLVGFALFRCVGAKCENFYFDQMNLNEN